MTETADKSGIAQAPPHMRRAVAEHDGHGRLLRGLARADWLALLVVALYTLALDARLQPPRSLYAALAAYALFIVAIRWRGFPVKAADARIALGAVAMVAFVAAVSAATGGAASPMANLFLLPVIVAAMTLGRQGTLIVFAAVTLAFLSLLAAEGPLGHPAEAATRLFGQLGPWALVAWLTHSLAGTITTTRRRIEELAERDGLTGMLNLRSFKGLLAREHGQRAREGRGGYAILLVDMDDLKALNDEHGHQAGNRGIATVASAIQRAIRATDMAARSGGDEFLVFLPDTTAEAAQVVAQRIRNHVYRSLFPVGERLQRMTASVGAATWPRDGSAAEDVVAAAAVRAKRDRELRRQGGEPAE